MLVGIYILKNLYIVFQNRVRYKFIYDSQRSLAKQLLTYYINKEYLFHVSTNVAELQRNVETDVIRFWDVVLAIIEMVMECMVCLVLFIYLIIADWQSTMVIASVLLLFMGMFVLVLRRYSVSLGALCRKWRASMTKNLLQIFAGVKEIKVTNKENFFIEGYDKAFEKYCITQRKQSIVTILPKPIMETVCVGGLLIVMSIRIFMGSDMKSFIPTLSAFVVAAYRMMPSFNRITAYYGNIMYGKASVENVYSDILEMRKNVVQQEVQELESYEFKISTDIELKDITFMYPNNEHAVLKNVSITIPKKSTVAFIGASGAGKSTLADIILGGLVPQKGKILVDGVNVYDHIKSWHRVIGYIPQVIYLLDDSIRNNVAFGLLPEDIDDEKIWNALKCAQIDEFVRTLPNELDTEVGDRGIRLSGGQRQRIGIARALYPNPELLILDEATSALDNETEKAVMQAIDGLRGSRTMVIIAHRLTTIKNCDLIYEIAEQRASLKEKCEVLH